MVHQLRLAIAAIVKNEIAYLLEWIAYHRVLGVTRFFIADNGSSDGTAHLLQQLNKCGIIQAISFLNEEGKPPQLPAYSALMTRFQREADWIAFFDADEFLLPTDGAVSIVPTIEEFDRIPQAGAIAINWAVFGSSGSLNSTSGLVIERFSRRGQQYHPVNNHYKSIVRSSAFLSTGENPHKFRLLPGFQTLCLSEEPVSDQRIQNYKRQEGISETACWNRLRLNHYVIKSYEEFLFRKSVRGRADSNIQDRDDGFFLNHDLNDIVDPLPDWLITETKNEMYRIMLKIKEFRGAVG